MIKINQLKRGKLGVINPGFGSVDTPIEEFPPFIHRECCSQIGLFSREVNVASIPGNLMTGV